MAKSTYLKFSDFTFAAFRHIVAKFQEKMETCCQHMKFYQQDETKITENCNIFNNFGKR